MDESKLNKLEKVINLIDTDYVTADDFAASLVILIEQIRNIGEGADESIAKAVSDITAQIALVQADISKTTTDSSNDKKMLSVAITGLRDDITALIESKVQSLKESIVFPEADLSAIEKRLNILEAEETIPDEGETADDIRNKLELLKGDDRLDRSAIRGLEDISTKADYQKLIDDLWQRTQFLINRGATSSSTVAGVSSVTGLNTNNTDPANPVVQISVDGTSITGSGTPGDPLVAITGGGGTVTDVTASAPLSSTGGATPNISVTLADASTDGYLSSADWNTFNSKSDPVNFETNGTPNGDQTLLNLVEGTNMSITDDGMGNITFDATGSSGSSALSDITAANADNTIDNLDWNQEWQWSTIDDNAFTFSTTTTDSINGSNFINITLDGVNAGNHIATTGLNIRNTHSGTESSNIGLSVSSTGASDNNIGITGIASGGNAVGGQFGVSSGSSATGISAVASGGSTGNVGGSFSAIGSGSTGSIGIGATASGSDVATGGSFNATGTSIGIGAVFSGTGADADSSIAAQFIGKVQVNSSGGPYDIAVGKEGANTGGITFYHESSGSASLLPASGSSLTLTLPVDGGTNGFFLQTDGSGNTTWAEGNALVIGELVTLGTPGSVLFIDPDQNLGEDNLYFRWDAIEHTLLSGDDSPYEVFDGMVALWIRDEPNSTLTQMMMNTSSTPNASTDLVFGNDATDNTTTFPIFDIGFNSSVGDLSHQTFEDAFGSPGTASFPNNSPQITSVGHGLFLNQVLQFTGSIPPELSLATNYYIVSIDDPDTFRISDTYGGTQINFQTIITTADYEIFGADLAGDYNIGTDTIQVIDITFDSGETRTATFEIPLRQVTWTVGLTMPAGDTVSGAFPFSSLTGSNTSYQYNTDGRHAFVNGTTGMTFDWYIGGYETNNNLMSLSDDSSSANLLVGNVKYAVPGIIRITSDTQSYISIHTPSGASTWDLTLPTDAGTVDYVLSTDGSGITSWVPASSGTTITPRAETPSGTINSSNATFTLANTPIANLSVIVTLNGLVQRNGSGLDYTVSGTTITFVVAPVTGSEIFAYYSS